MKQGILLFIAAVIMGPQTSFAQASQEYLTSAGTLELRDKPNWESPSKGKLIRGEPVRVLEHGEVWAKLNYRGQEMYVPFALLSESSPWVPEEKARGSAKISAHFRKKRSRSSKEIRETLKNVENKTSLQQETELIDDPELIAQLSGGPALGAEGDVVNPMDEGAAAAGASSAAAEGTEEKSAGATPPEAGATALPAIPVAHALDGSTDTSDPISRDPAKAKSHAPQAFGPALKKSDSMKFDLKSIRRMDKYKLSEKDLRRFRAQGQLSTGE